MNTVNYFLPEGFLSDTAENSRKISLLAENESDLPVDTIMEARAVLCDREHNLHVDLNSVRGIIPREECILDNDNEIKEIAFISRVNKPVMFVPVKYITLPDGKKGVLLSRKKAQRIIKDEYLDSLADGEIIDAAVTRLENFGAFCDVGAGVSALLPIDNISVSRIPHPSARLRKGQRIKVAVKSRDEKGRLILTHKELLGTWEENAALFSPGETVPGIVRSVEEYGIFIELTANLAGLAEYEKGIENGERASVFIKSINPEKMKIKLSVVDSFTADYPPDEPNYFITGGRLDHWVYSPAGCNKIIETFF